MNRRPEPTHLKALLRTEMRGRPLTVYMPSEGLYLDELASTPDKVVVNTYHVTDADLDRGWIVAPSRSRPIRKGVAALKTDHDSIRESLERTSDDHLQAAAADGRRPMTVAEKMDAHLAKLADAGCNRADVESFRRQVAEQLHESGLSADARSPR